MNDGWIKLHRKILDSGVAKDPEYLAVWIHLLLLANYTDKTFIWNNKKMVCKSGQLLTSRKKLASISGVHESKIERAIKFLKSEQQIEQQNMFTNRLITINNWNEYQQSEQQNEQQMNSKRTASEQQVNTNKNEKKEKKERRKSSNEDLSAPGRSLERSDVTEMVDALKATVGIDAFVDSGIERNMARHCVGLMEKIGRKEFGRRLNVLLADDFHAKNCNKIKYIYNNIKGFREPKKPGGVFIS